MYMYIDLPKLPNKPTYVIERPFSKMAEEDHTSNDFANQQMPEPPDIGGYAFMTASTTGTAASGTSISTVRSYQITFMPREGVIPLYEMELNHEARNLEQITNPTKKLG